MNTNKKIIQSFSYSQDEILRSIVELHVPGGIELDATYGRGNFYKEINEPRYRYDKEPKVNGVVSCNSRKLPHCSCSVKSIMYDPPFIITDHKESEHYIMHKRFSGYRVLSELREDYSKSIAEFARILVKGGILVVKCQDTTHGKVNYFIHNEVLEMATNAGFSPKDLFILGNKNRFNSNIHKQRTARKHHCYFWVFEKRKRTLARTENIPLKLNFEMGVPAL